MTAPDDYAELREWCARHPMAAAEEIAQLRLEFSFLAATVNELTDDVHAIGRFIGADMSRFRSTNELGSDS